MGTPTGNTIKEVAPHQLAWLRRRELDTEKGDVWEQPDGRLFIMRPGTGDKLRLQIIRPIVV